MPEFPPNSNKSKEPPPEKKVEKVVTGEVIQKKKSFGSKFRDTFLGGDLKSTRNYVLAEVLLPALRNLVFDAMNKGTERMIYGDQHRPSVSGQPGRPRIQYNRPGDQYSPQRRGYLPGESSRMSPRRNDLSDIIMHSIEDAENIVDGLRDIIEKYDIASMADFKEMAGMPPNFVDHNWGWSSMRHIDIRQVREGWLIVLPPPEPI